VQAGEVPVPAQGITGILDITERDDGAFQVTYDDLPLCFLGNSESPGDTTGHEVCDVWFVVPLTEDIEN